MKLYYKPGACSLASHIVLNETGLPFELIEVNTDTKKTQSGDDYLAINAKGYVPALKLKNGDVLTEGTAILQFLSDQESSPFKKVEDGSLDKTRLQEYLNYTASELHKAFGPFFQSGSSAGDKAKAKTNVHSKFDYLETVFADGRDYLLGSEFSVADAYLFVVANWARFVGIDLKDWSKLQDFVDRVSLRPAVLKAMKTEGLIS